MVGSGQGCVCGSRIFVQRTVFDQVVEGIAGIANFRQLGGPKEEGTHIGPLISQKQLTRVMGYVDEGEAVALTITLNTQLPYEHHMPFGGYKQSGWGREFGKGGIEMYLQEKSVYSLL